MPEVVGFFSGVFDLFHVGHLENLKLANSGCDRLVVGVASDELARMTRGTLPIVPAAERREIVAAVRGVDDVVPIEHFDVPGLIADLAVDVVFVGDAEPDGPSVDTNVEDQLRRAGVRVVRIVHGRATSSATVQSALGQRSSVA